MVRTAIGSTSNSIRASCGTDMVAVRKTESSATLTEKECCRSFIAWRQRIQKLIKVREFVNSVLFQGLWNAWNAWQYKMNIYQQQRAVLSQVLAHWNNILAARCFIVLDDDGRRR